jgi:S-adenosylmethionine hydrolase
MTTDFGLIDPFVGVMKGVIAGICPLARTIDITHGVEAFSVLGGAVAIWQAWRYFPAETVHLVVVDPGVGSERLPLLARLGSHWFIAPDNGVLKLVEREVSRTGGTVWYRRLNNPKYRLPSPSHTFHGRDIFAPGAAHLARHIERGNVAAETFGPVLESAIDLPVPDPVRSADGSVEGAILKSDIFGNLLTNLTAGDLPNSGEGFAIELGEKRITRLAHFFGEADPGELFAFVGSSSGFLEIAINQGSAREATGAVPGTRFRAIPESK